MSSGTVQLLEDAYYIPVLVIGCMSSMLSMLGSSCVLYMTANEFRYKILHRLVFGLSLADFLSSTAVFFMPFSIPSFLGIPGAVGTHATCSLTGFFFLMNAMTGAVYNAYLSVYYLLLVQRNWREQDFKKWEIWAHSFVALVPLALSLAAAVSQSINPGHFIYNVCVQTPFPWGCEFEDNCERSSLEVTRSLALPVMGLILLFSVLGFVCTCSVCWTVQRTIRRASLHRFQGDVDQAQSDRIKQVQIQAALYSLVFFNTLFWPLFSVILADSTRGVEEKSLTSKPGYYVFFVGFWAFYPLQGFLNFFVFTRVKVKQWRKREPDRFLFWIYKQILFSTPVPNNTTRLTTRLTTAPTSRPKQHAIPQEENPAGLCTNNDMDSE